MNLTENFENYMDRIKDIHKENIESLINAGKSIEDIEELGSMAVLEMNDRGMIRLKVTIDFLQFGDE